MLRTKRLVLRPLRAGDEGWITRHIADPEVHRWLTSVPHPCADHPRKSRPAPEGGGSVPHLSTPWPIAATPHHRNLPANQSLCPWRTSESVRIIDSDFRPSGNPQMSLIQCSLVLAVPLG